MGGGAARESEKEQERACERERERERELPEGSQGQRRKAGECHGRSWCRGEPWCLWETQCGSAQRPLTGSLCKAAMPAVHRVPLTPNSRGARPWQSSWARHGRMSGEAWASMAPRLIESLSLAPPCTAGGIERDRTGGDASSPALALAHRRLRDPRGAQRGELPPLVVVHSCQCAQTAPATLFTPRASHNSLSGGTNRGRGGGQGTFLEARVDDDRHVWDGDG